MSTKTILIIEVSNASTSKIFRIISITRKLNVNTTYTFKTTLSSKRLKDNTIEVPIIIAIRKTTLVCYTSSEILRIILKTPSVEPRTG